ncbi:hypothetical protein RFI_05642, partial [Reticulomyxa filosa]
GTRINKFEKNLYHLARFFIPIINTNMDQKDDFLDKVKEKKKKRNKQIINNNNKEVHALLHECTESEREAAINSILGALKVNPIEVLQLPINYQESDIKEQYKKLSLLVHPDRIKEDSALKESAAKAFAKLAEARRMISDPKYQNKLKVQILEAKRRIEARKSAARLEEEINGIRPAATTSASSLQSQVHNRSNLATTTTTTTTATTTT